jgi:hypothetical protein
MSCPRIPCIPSVERVRDAVIDPALVIVGGLRALRLAVGDVVSLRRILCALLWDVAIYGSDDSLLATLRSASASIGGSAFPRLSARRRIPRHAFAESEYRLGASDSRTRDNEHSTPSLGHSEISTVQNSPRDLRTIPAFAHFTEDGCEVESSIAREQSWDILENEDGGPKSSNNPHCIMEETAPISCESSALARDRKILTWEPAADDIDGRELVRIDLGDITVDGCVREASAKDGLRGLVPLDAPGDLKSRALKAKVEAADSCKQTSDFHGQALRK